MPIENDNTVVQVPLFYLERRMWAAVTRHPLQFFKFFKEGCKNYLKISLFGGSLQQVPSAVENLRLVYVLKISLKGSHKGCHCGGEK